MLPRAVEKTWEFIAMKVFATPDMLFAQLRPKIACVMRSAYPWPVSTARGQLEDNLRLACSYFSLPPRRKRRGRLKPSARRSVAPVRKKSMVPT